MPVAAHSPRERTGGDRLQASEPNPTPVVTRAQTTDQPLRRQVSATAALAARPARPCSRASTSRCTAVARARTKSSSGRTAVTALSDAAA